MPLSSPVAIEPVERAFAVLEILNRCRTGTLTTISQAAGLPRSTTARLLETLVALGYVAHLSRKIGYRITDRVLALSAGVRFIDHLVRAAAGPMSAFTVRTGWPVYLGTVSDTLVLIRHSTAPQTPLSFESAGYDRKFKIYESALGLAYLAFCPTEERSSMIRSVSEPQVPNGISSRQRAALERELARIRGRGFSFTRPSRPRRLNGLAVPIVKDGHVLGALTLRYPRRAMTEDEAAARYAHNSPNCRGRLQSASSMMPPPTVRGEPFGPRFCSAVA